ncbi:MAG: acyl-CoA dehydrogenase N-terminal domain-containing protein, partial [Novosphingobium sp.]
MPTYKAPTGDARFLINEVLRLQDYAALPGFAGATPDMVEAVVEEAGKFCSEVLAPINLAGDQEGCTRHPDGSVSAPSVYKPAFAQFREAGWSTLSVPEEFGGQCRPASRSSLPAERRGWTSPNWRAWPRPSTPPMPTSRRRP